MVFFFALSIGLKLDYFYFPCIFMVEQKGLMMCMLSDFPRTHAKRSPPMVFSVAYAFCRVSFCVYGGPCHTFWSVSWITITIRSIPLSWKLGSTGYAVEVTPHTRSADMLNCSCGWHIFKTDRKENLIFALIVYIHV